MASVNIKNEAPTYTTINIPEETEFENCFTHYSLALNKLFLIVTEPAHPHDAAIQYYIKIDPETDKTEFQKFNGISEAMNGKIREKYSGTGNYIGPMRQFTNNDDGSFTTVYENGFTYSMLSGGQNYSTGYTGKIMVSTYNSKAEILSEYLVPKLYINTGSPYKDLLFINNGKSSYMCINDTRRNNKVSKNNYAEVGGIGDCDAFYYKLEGTDNFPGRDYVFGDQDKSRLLIANRYANYSKAENSLAAMRLTITPEKRKQCNIVWLQPQ